MSLSLSSISIPWRGISFFNKPVFFFDESTIFLETFTSSFTLSSARWKSSIKRIVFSETSLSDTIFIFSRESFGISSIGMDKASNISPIEITSPIISFCESLHFVLNGVYPEPVEYDCIVPTVIIFFPLSFWISSATCIRVVFPIPPTPYTSMLSSILPSSSLSSFLLPQKSIRLILPSKYHDTIFWARCSDIASISSTSFILGQNLVFTSFLKSSTLSATSK